MSVPTFRYTASLNTNLGTPTVVVTDTTDYSLFDITLMLGILKAEGPAAVWYNNTDFGSPDFNGAIDTITKTLDLPLSNGVVPTGTYKFTITPQYNGVTQTPVVVTVVLNVAKPTPVLNIGWDCTAGRLTGTDNTDPSANLPSGVTLVSYIRVLTLVYPADSGQSDIESPLQLIVIGSNTAYVFGTGEYQLKLVGKATYLLPDGNTVVYEITGITATDGKVTCEYGLCCIKDCIYKVFKQYVNALKTSPVKANELFKIYIQITGYWNDLCMNRECGNPDKVAHDIKEIKELIGQTDCDCCNENSDSWQIIRPLTPINSNTVVTAGTYITVSSVTVGDTTTYTVNVNDAFIAIVRANTDNIAELELDIAEINASIALIVSSKYRKLYEYDIDATTAGTGNQVLGSYDVGTNILKNNGDELVVTGDYYNSVNDFSGLWIDIAMNAQDLGTGGLFLFGNNQRIFVKITIARIDNTHYSKKFEIFIENILINSNTIMLELTNLSSIDFTANDIFIEWIGHSITNTTVTLKKSKVELFLK